MKKLSQPLSCFKGAGPRRCALLERLGLRTAEDVLYFFPRRYEDRRNVRKISALVPGAPAVVCAEVRSIETKVLFGRVKRLTQCTFFDGSGFLVAAWFNRRGLETQLKPGTKAALFGTPFFHGSSLEMTEPEFIVLNNAGDEKSFTGIVPLYPITEGLTQKWLRNFIGSVVGETTPFVKETLPQSLIEKNDLMDLPLAISEMHAPKSPESWKTARRRLAYEELFTLQLQMIAARSSRNEGKGVPLKKGAFFEAFIASLPFDLTDSQRHVTDEIFEDGASGRPLSRLLQGDVGSGKTAAALAFAAVVCDSGAQCAILAPTEVLAEQLYSQTQKYLSPAGIKCGLLKSRLSAPERNEILRGAAEGTLNVITGTQSLLSDEVVFKKLGAVIIDEQQRFGVRQRARLLCGETTPHLLMMSATPIPRTTALTLYGDLDISVIKEKPKGRIPVETRLIGDEQIAKLLKFIVDETGAGGRVYWICPRVEDDDVSNLPAAEERFEQLKKVIPNVPASLIHGQMKSEEKESAFEDFRSGRSLLLVGTTVLEVGVDVPEATVIVIESPERYGLSQLHQMRGRVGRGGRRGVCVLLSHNKNIAERLRFFASTDDGFEIANADLKFRGAGEITGTAQHGFIKFRAADIQKDIRLAEIAREDAKEIIEKKELDSLPEALRLRIDEAAGRLFS